MSKQVDLSMQAFNNFADELASYTGNLAKTAGVFEEIVAPVAKKSGSQLLEGVSADVTSIKEEFQNKFKTAVEAQAGIKEYTDKLRQMNSL